MAELVVKIDTDGFNEMIENFKKENPDFFKVVRCKDCEFAEKVFPKRNTDLLKCSHCRDYLEPNDFCSWGEQKGGAE